MPDDDLPEKTDAKPKGVTATLLFAPLDHYTEAVRMGLIAFDPVQVRVQVRGTR